MSGAEAVNQQQKYPPLSEVRKSLRIKWYRCPVDTATLHELLKRDDLQGFIQAGGHWGLWLLTATVAYSCYADQSWWWLLAALFLHGTVASFFKGTSVHELGHGTVFKTQWLNQLFLYTFSTISWCTYHHRYTLHPDGDRENLLPLSPMVGRTFLIQLFTINLLTETERTFSKGGVINTVVTTFRSALGRGGELDNPSNQWVDALHREHPAQHRKSIWWSRWLLLFHGLVVLFSIVTGQWIWVLIVSFSSYTANWLSYLLGMTQHCGLKENDTDFRKSVRSIRINPFFAFLYWRMNWHTEHHMFAGVPCYNLGALHNAVRDDMPEPRTLIQAWREMIDTWRKQQVDPDYFYDTPVPERKANDDQTELHTSIGELAPGELRHP